MPIPFRLTEWELIPPTITMGASGVAQTRTELFDGLRVRLVEYSENYLADHWCAVGHFVLVLEGELIIALKDGGERSMKKDCSFIVSDDLSEHRLRTIGGARVLVIDGAFLAQAQGT